MTSTNPAQPPSPDRMVMADLADNWSDLRRHRSMPEINFDRLRAYRLRRIKTMIKAADIALCVMVNPISLRYAVDYSNYAQFQAHIPTTYLFVPAEGPSVIYGAYGHKPAVDEMRSGRQISFFDGGPELTREAALVAGDVVDFLSEIGTDNRRVAMEYVNPSLTRALMGRGLEVVDGVGIVERARAIKSLDEIACIRWAVAVAEFGIGKVAQAVAPGVSENQLWGLLNYTNLANHGAWHDGRMLASGPRINPWLQEASGRRVEAGDLVGFDTDMIGPNGYFADVSRTLFCGPGRPDRRQKQLYRLAVEEIEFNLGLIRPGVSLMELQANAFPVPEAFHAHAYPCIIHGVGMCDEYPRVNHRFRDLNPYDGVLEAGMVLCVESFMGAVGERDGVKLEQQILVTNDGYEMLTTYPLDEDLMS